MVMSTLNTYAIYTTTQQQLTTKDKRDRVVKYCLSIYALYESNAKLSCFL